MLLGRRQLFIYWNVTESDLPAAVAALRQWQSGLISQHPALRCGLYRRSSSERAEATMMESYAIESEQPHPGIGEALLLQIDQSGSALLKHWLRGARHVEVFDTLTA
jgi:hypothetical protein